jgi:hypothetical protein
MAEVVDNSTDGDGPRLDKRRRARGCSPESASGAPTWRCMVRGLSTILVVLVVGALLVYTLRRRR